MSVSVGVFVDGDNLGSSYAQELTKVGESYGRVVTSRVYGNEQTLKNWQDNHDFQFMYSGCGKNASDIHLAIEVTEFTLTHSLDVVLLCSSDADFAHLARRLRERGIRVVGCGEIKTSAKFRKACSCFYEVAAETVTDCEQAVKPKVSGLDLQIKTVIAENSQKGAGMQIPELNSAMRAKHGTIISKHPDGSWRKYFENRDTLFKLDPRGPEARVRYNSCQF